MARHAADAAAADWLGAEIRDFAGSVRSLVPGRFAAYVRVFHPAYRRGTPETAPVVPVEWAAIAAATGRVAHGGMQLAALTGSVAGSNDPLDGVYDAPPRVGSLPTGQLSALLPALAAHTASPDRCWFAVWEGFGALRPQIRDAPSFELPHRRYHLLEGPAAAALENLALPPSVQSANLWWPDDRAWCVASEIDLNSTYIGCSRAAAEAILGLPQVEAWPLDPPTGIDAFSDTVNPSPAA